MEMLNQKQKMIAVIGIAVVVIIVGYYYINSTKGVYEHKEVQNFIENDEETNEEENAEEIKTILVHVTGAVEKSGVVKVKENARINDAIEAAGGVTDDADLSDVNLAYIIEDGQKIYIPSKNDKKVESIEEKSGIIIITESSGNNVIKEDTENEVKNQKVNINKADIDELMSLQGIGEATACKIIEYRALNGKFKSIEELKNVSGVGDAKYNAVKDYITV